MTSYPHVLGEMDTLALVRHGQSIARYGDGEFALAENRSIRTQKFAPDLAARLRGILQGDGAPCLVGIPNILSPTPKAKYWEKYKRCAALLSPTQNYVSSFITRPDNAPWLNSDAYWDAIESLWRGLDVTLVHGTDPMGTGGISLLASDLRSAKSVREIVGPATNAWNEYPALLERIGTPRRALLCLGVTATVMAVDLCAKGVHAIDLGHVGLFRNRHMRGLPMARTRAEKALAI